MLACQVHPPVHLDDRWIGVYTPKLFRDLPCWFLSNPVCFTLATDSKSFSIPEKDTVIKLVPQVTRHFSLQSLPLSAG